MFEPQERNEALTAEREVQARDEGAVAVDSEPEAIRDVEIAKREVFPLGGDFAGIDEQRTVERPPRFPPVLGAQQQAVAILEAELAEATQRLRAAQPRLKVERHILARAGIREHR